MNSSARTPWRRHGPLFAIVAIGVAAVSACSGGNGGSGTPAASPTAAPAAAASAALSQRPRPAVTGQIAAIDGTTMQVQDGTSQTAVTYSKTTTFTQAVPAALAEVSVGACVTVTRADTSSSATPTAGENIALVAGHVTISAPADGVCTGSFGGFGGFAGGSGQAGGTRNGNSAGPSGAPQRDGARPSGAPGQPDLRSAFRGVTGQVTAVTSTGFVLKSTRRPPANDGATPADTNSTTVTVSPATVLSKPKAASAGALAVGECVTAVGPADTTGAVTAKTIAIRADDGNGCGGRRAAQPSGAGNG